MEVTETKKGYKQTKLGWIPEDWEVYRFDEVFQFIPTYSYSRNQLIKSQPNDRDVFNIHYGDIHTSFHNEQLDFDKNIEVASLLNSDVDMKKLKLLKEGDMVIADASEDYEGICDAIELKNVKNRKIIGGLHTFAVRDKIGLTANGYRGFIFKNEIVKHNLKRVATGISVLGVSKSNISKILIPLPPTSEQVVISKVLLKWDNAITKLNALIKAKQKCKKGLMQQLLTGKKRLPGFDKEWEKLRLGDVTNFFSRRNKELMEARVYSVTNYDGFVYQSDHFSRELVGDDLASYKIIKKNEFAYNPARINVGSIAFFEDEIGIISSLYVCFSTNEKMTDDYMKYLIQLEKTQFDFNRYGEGGVRIYLWYPLFASIKVEIPSIKEQRAISKLLLAADKEIQLLEEQLSQLELQKKGMMQQLLTGKKRLKD